MNFEFKKPVFSFKKNLAMLLAVIMCMGQFSVPVAAAAVVRGDGSLVEGSDYIEGDVSGDASGNASWYVSTDSEYYTISYSDVLKYVKLKGYMDSGWTEKSADEAFLNGEITIDLYQQGRYLTGLNKQYTEYDMTVGEDTYNTEFLFKVYYRRHEIGSVNYTFKRSGWKASHYNNNDELVAFPGKPAELRVVVAPASGSESIDLDGFKYQWQTGHYDHEYEDIVYEDINGATNNSYDVKYAEAGRYRCVVSHGEAVQNLDFYVYQESGLVVSSVGRGRKYLKSGETVRLEVAAYSELEGVSIAKYQWQKFNKESNKYEDIPRETSNSLLIDSIGEYLCIVTDSNGSSESSYFEVGQAQRWDGDFSSTERELKVNQSIDVETKGEQWCFYAITPKATGTYTFYSEGDHDPEANLIDSEGYVLEYNDDGNEDDGVNFRINRQLTGGQKYFLAVKSLNDSVITIKVSAICAAHTKTEVRNAKAATCTEDGYTGDKCCVNCGEIVEAGNVIKATGHSSTVVRNGKAATCTADGYTGDKCCVICGAIVEAGSVIAKTGHSFGAWAVTKQPTVFAEGIQARVCSVCGAREEQAIAKLQPQAKLNMTTVPLKVKQTTTLKVNNVVGGDAVASFKSSNTKIATVTSAGKITAKKKGTATVTVTMKSGQVLKATVKVQTGNVKTTKVTANVTKVSLDMKKTFQLKAVVTPLTSKEKVTFKSSNSKIVTVSKTGKLTAKKPGKATITVQSGKKKCYVKVTVNPVKTTAITVNKTQVKLKVKKSFTLKTKLTPGNSTEAVTYKTSNKKVATVSSKGKITAKKAGTATITVKSGNQSVKVQVTVTKK